LATFEAALDAFAYEKRSYGQSHAQTDRARKRPNCHSGVAALNFGATVLAARSGRFGHQTPESFKSDFGVPKSASGTDFES
jgi:hypothetical protein